MDARAEFYEALRTSWLSGYFSPPPRERSIVDLALRVLGFVRKRVHDERGTRTRLEFLGR